MRTLHKKKSDKNRKNFEDGCKSCNCPSLKCAYSEIERAEIRMRPNDRRNRIIELLSFRRHETLDNLAHEFGVSRYTIMRDIVQLQEKYPIKAKCGYEGCYSLPDGYYISEKHLTPKQANAVRECIVTADSELRPILESILDDFAW